MGDGRMSTTNDASTHGLSLDQVCLVESHYIEKRRTRPKTLVCPPCGASYTHEVRKPASGRNRLICRLALEFDPKAPKAAFWAKVVYEAVYSFGEDIELDVGVFADGIAPAHMYPFIREHIATLTGKGRFPPLLLPPVNISRLLKTSPSAPTE